MSIIKSVIKLLFSFAFFINLLSYSYALDSLSLCTGDSADINYSSIDAASCDSIISDYGVETIEGANLASKVTITAQSVGTTFIFTCRNSAVPAVLSSKQVLLTIKSPSDPSCAQPLPGAAPSITFDANPKVTTITSGPIAVTYNLSHTNAQSCEIVTPYGVLWSRNTPLTGPISIPQNTGATGGPLQATAECWSGSNGTGNKSVQEVITLNLSCPVGKNWVGLSNKCVWNNAPAPTLTINKATAQQGEKFLVSYTCDNTDSFKLGENTFNLFGPIAYTPGSLEYSFENPTTHPFILTCYSEPNGGGTEVSVTRNITITPRPYPDLRISDGPYTSALTAGIDVTLTATARNYGAATTGGSIPNIFIVADGPSGTGNRTIIAANRVATLPPTVTGVFNATHRFPAQGSYSILACTDIRTDLLIAGDIDEGSGENNNCSDELNTSWTNIAIAPPVQNIDLVSDAHLSFANDVAETPVVFTYQFTNTGSQSTLNGFPNLFKYSLSSDGSSHTLDQIESYGNPLGAGDTGQVLFTKTFNTPNTYYVSACVDQDITGASTINEDNPNNNCTGWDPIVISPKINSDLAGNSMSYPATIRAGVSAPFIFNISNVGTTPAQPNFLNSFIVTQNSDNTNLDYQIVVNYPNVLNQGANDTITFNKTFNNAGTYYITACVNRDGNGITNPDKTPDNDCTTRYTVEVLSAYDPISISIKSDVAVPISTDIAIPTTATLEWQSNVDSCEVWDKQTPSNRLNTAPRTGTAPSYNYTYFLTSHSPQYRTELNTTHLGTNALGYDIRCSDSAVPSRGITSRTINVETYMKTVPSFTLNEASNILIAKCTPDFDYVMIKKDDVVMTGYPKTYTTNQSSPFTTQFTPAIGSIYTLTCKSFYTSANTSIAVHRVGSTGNDLSISAALDAGANFDSKTVLGAEDTLRVVSKTGRFDNLYVNVSNADSWDVRFYNQHYADNNNPAPAAAIFAGNSTNPGNLPADIRLLGGLINNVNKIGTTNEFLSGFTLKVTAVKNGVAKILWVKMDTQINPLAFLTYTPTPTIIDPNLIEITARCQNATNFELRHTNIGGTGQEVIISEPTGQSGIFTKIISNYDLGLQDSGSNANLRLTCSNGGNNGVAEKNIPVSTRAPAEIKSFNALPAELTCPGGNNEVNLNWTIGNTYSKECRVRAESTTGNNSLAAQEQMSYINGSNMLGSSNLYTSTSLTGAGDMLSTMDKRDPNTLDSKAKIQLKFTDTVPSGKLPNSGNRLFYYSTRFTIECDDRNLPVASKYSPTNTTYSKRSVDVVAKCTTQN